MHASVAHQVPRLTFSNLGSAPPLYDEKSVLFANACVCVLFWTALPTRQFLEVEWNAERPAHAARGTTFKTQMQDFGKYGWPAGSPELLL